jgi:hypothetical protein
LTKTRNSNSYGIWWSSTLTQCKQHHPLKTTQHPHPQSVASLFLIPVLHQHAAKTTNGHQSYRRRYPQIRRSSFATRGTKAPGNRSREQEWKTGIHWEIRETAIKHSFCHGPHHGCIEMNDGGSQELWGSHRMSSFPTTGYNIFTTSLMRSCQDTRLHTLLINKPSRQYCSQNMCVLHIDSNERPL